MIVPFNDLRAEYYSLQEEIDGAIRRVLESGKFVMGEELDAFEKEFALYCGAKHAIGVGSGTGALHLALLACGIGPGDEVITVPNTDLPTAAAISYCGANIVWVDVDASTFNIDPNRLEAKITKRTKAILPVHLFGHPADMDSIMEVAKRYNLSVIEDACLAAGAGYKGRKVGTIGDVGCFSLAPTKMLGAYGDGGVVITDHGKIADRIKILRNYGHSLEMESKSSELQGPTDWEFVTEGFNERLDELQAAIVRVKLPTLEKRLARRREIASEYNNLLDGLDLVSPYEAPEVKHVYRTYTILVRQRDRVRECLTSKGIATRLYYGPLPLHLQTVYARLGYHKGDFPVTEEIADRMLSLPIFPQMTQLQIEEVVSALEECAELSKRTSSSE
jgi:dTDP-4-amino-4,6-dideoxygalactose transaminase